MRRPFRLGRISGIEVDVHWTVPVLAMAMMYGLYAVVLPSAVAGRPAADYANAATQIVVLVLAGLFAHAFAHVPIARHYGVTVQRVTVWPLGGWSEPAGRGSVRADLVVAAAGPVIHLLLSGVAELAAAAAKTIGLPALTVTSLTWYSSVNIVLALVNVLPGAPLDGGRVVRAIVWRRRGDRRVARIVAGNAGIVVGVLLAVAGLAQVLRDGLLSGFWLVLLGWLTAAAAAEEATVDRVAERSR